MKSLKRISLIAFAIILLIVPLSADIFAVDPVSSATMANALAQALTAYGASQGVSMTFDVASSDGIGEGVHDLWNHFKADINDNDVPTYDSLAVTVWATLFKKINNHVAINVDAENVEYFDRFWNWLLSGPAELTKVDNQYYEWTVDQSGSVLPIPVFSFSPYSNVPITNANAQSLFANGLILEEPRISNYYYQHAIGKSSDVPMFVFGYRDGNNMVFEVCSTASNTYYRGDNEALNNLFFTSNTTSVPYLSIYHSSFYGRYNSNFTYSIPIYSTVEDGLDAYIAFLNSGSTQETISVAPYVGDTIPQDVYIPDTDDPDYGPLPYVGELGIPWNDTLYGDGADTLTDAQSEAVTFTLDDAITQSETKTLELAETAPPPVTPSEVYIPFLPVSLPNFNFSLSGIWHYVQDWVTSLGAWFSLVFSMWAALPYAIIVPVYASAVVVIVLGVYKRFFM